MDSEGRGWLYKHVHSMISFVRANPKITSAHAQKHCETLASFFDAAWRNKVIQLQISIFSSGDNAWLLNLDGILADALELGPLRDTKFLFPTSSCLESPPSRLPAYLWKRPKLSLPITTPINPPTPIGSSCPSPILTPGSAPPASAANGSRRWTGG